MNDERSLFVALCRSNKILAVEARQPDAVEKGQVPSPFPPSSTELIGGEPQMLYDLPELRFLHGAGYTNLSGACFEQII
jgi:hypothetical protein